MVVPASVKALFSSSAIVALGVDSVIGVVKYQSFLKIRKSLPDKFPVIRIGVNMAGVAIGAVSSIPLQSPNIETISLKYIGGKSYIKNSW